MQQFLSVFGCCYYYYVHCTHAFSPIHAFTWPPVPETPRMKLSGCREFSIEFNMFFVIHILGTNCRWKCIIYLNCQSNKTQTFQLKRMKSWKHVKCRSLFIDCKMCISVLHYTLIGKMYHNSGLSVTYSAETLSPPVNAFSSHTADVSSALYPWQITLLWLVVKMKESVKDQYYESINFN